MAPVIVCSSQYHTKEWHDQLAKCEPSEKKTVLLGAWRIEFSHIPQIRSFTAQATDLEHIIIQIPTLSTNALPI
jgi:hypothetical protein